MSGVPVPTWPTICAALRAISSRSPNRGKTLRFSAQVAWNGKSSDAMGRCRQAPSYWYWDGALRYHLICKYVLDYYKEH